MRDPIDSLQPGAVADMVHALRQRLLAGAPTTRARLRLRFCADFTVIVESNAPALLEFLAGYYCEFADGERAGADAPGRAPVLVTALQSHPPPIESMFYKRPFVINPTTSPRGPKESWLDVAGGRLVRKLRTGMVYLFGGRENLVIGDCLANDSQVVNFINNRLIQARLDQGCLLGHAAAVTGAAGRTIVFAGFPGMGKSTLSLRVMGYPGVDFVSNDRVMFGPDGRGRPWAYGVPKHPRINPGTILHNERLGWIFSDEERARFSAMDPDALWDLEQKHDGLIHRSFGLGRFKLDAPLTAVVLMSWRRDAAARTCSLTRIDPAARRDLLPALMKSPGLFYNPPGGGRATVSPPEDYIAGLRGVEVYELAGRVDFEAAAEACARYVREGDALDA